MNEKATELVMIIDQSGSMSGLESDTIGGFNSMIRKQKKEEGEVYVSTVLFDTDTKVLHDRVPLCEVKEMTGSDYMPAGCTALYDAIGGAIRHISRVHRYIRKEDVPAKTLFVITTDGMENASRNYSQRQIRQMIEEKKKDGWEFLFVAADIDAYSAAGDCGIAADRAANYRHDSGGTDVLYESISRTVSNFRMNSCISEDWAKAINEDVNSHKM